jgi:hypothetical protein
MTINTCKTLGELIFQVQAYASTLHDEGIDQRLTLYMIRDSAWRAMCEIDKATLATYGLSHAKPAFDPLDPDTKEVIEPRHPRRAYTIDDLEI